MSREKFIKKFRLEIDHFEKKYKCDLNENDKRKVIETYSQYLIFISNLKDIQEVKSLSNRAIHFCLLKSKTILKPLTPGGFQYGGDRTWDYRKSGGNEGRIEDNKEELEPIKSLKEYQKIIFFEGGRALSKLYPDKIDILESIICPQTPDIVPAKWETEVKWWKEIERKKHEFAYDFYKKLSHQPSEKEVLPADNWEWIEKEYSNNRENFKSDESWAEKTAKKFEDVFGSKTSPGSMKRYGIYGGRN